MEYKLKKTILKMGHKLCKSEKELKDCLVKGICPIIEWDNNFWQVENQYYIFKCSNCGHIEKEKEVEDLTIDECGKCGFMDSFIEQPQSKVWRD